MPTTPSSNPVPGPGSSAEKRRRLQVLVAGILACAVVIGLCIVALVVLFDRFTAHVGDDCPESGCHSKGAATTSHVAPLLRVAG